MRSIWKVALIWGLVGLAVALLLGVVGAFTHALGLIQIVLWPASIGAMAENSSATRVDLIEQGMVLAFMNFALYFVLGLVVTAIRRGWLYVKRGLVRRASP